MDAYIALCNVGRFETLLRACTDARQRWTIETLLTAEWAKLGATPIRQPYSWRRLRVETWWSFGRCRIARVWAATRLA
jgi:hypothetical protein